MRPVTSDDRSGELVMAIEKTGYYPQVVSAVMARQAPVERLTALGVPHYDNPSHIVPVMVGDPVLCKQISDRLLDEFAIYLQPINYPTVPRGTERLRITPSPLHSDSDIEDLVNALGTIWSEMSLRKAA